MNAARGSNSCLTSPCLKTVKAFAFKNLFACLTCLGLLWSMSAVNAVESSERDEKPALSSTMISTVSPTIGENIDNQQELSAIVRGTAYDLQDFKPLYFEEYFLLALDGSSEPFTAGEFDSVLLDHRKISAEIAVNHPGRRVIYSEATESGESNELGNIFAVKDINYRFSSQSPYYRIIDYRLGQVQSATSNLSQSLWSPEQGSAVRLSMQNFAAIDVVSSGIDPVRAQADTLFTKLSETGQLDSKKDDTVSFDGLVSDAGFDRFIAENWSLLVDQQQSIDFDFAVPSRAQAVPMAITPVGAETCAEKVLGDVPETIKSDASIEHCFKLTAKSWIVAQVLKPIYLTYSADKRLSVFRGLSNIRGAGNERLRVFIQYQY